MYEIEAYQCDYCTKYSKSKSVMKKHESKCFHNPVSRACVTCGNYFQEHYKVDIKPDDSFSYVGDIYSCRPICKAGKSISSLKDSKLTVSLCNNCEYWIEKEEED